MDLRRSDFDGFKRLASIWKTTPGAELEALLTGLDLTSWQDVIQYLRSLGMRENPQIVRLNICLSNDIRFTLEGAGVIQAYCRDNRLTDKPYTAMLKEAIADAEPVDVGLYGARAKLKREIPLAADDARVKEALARWDQLSKLYRQIQRFEFVAPGGRGLRFDVSIVREARGRTYQEARVISMPSRYEAEVELTASREGTEPDRAASLIIQGLSWLLQGRQRSFVLVSRAASDYVHGSLQRIFGPSMGGNGGNRGTNGRNRNAAASTSFRYPGPQPATLERRHMAAEPEPGVPNLRGGYNVTDKADGLRALLFVAEDGKVFLVDGGGRVYGTGKRADAAVAGVVLDGEWIRRDKTGKTVSHFYAFDILAGRGGDIGVVGLPFMVPGAMVGSAAASGTRQAVMAAAVGVLGSAAQTVRGVPASQNLQIGMKTFRSAAPGAGDEIFRDCAAAVLEDAKSAPYNTDGLIFTPNASPLPLGRGSWLEQLKWKPPHENTVDFLVIVDKERSKEGVPSAVDAVGTKYREDSGQTVRYKTLRLFVGSNRDVAFADPRTTVLSDAALPRSLDQGEWREVEFRPTEPRDPMAAICYIAIGEGAADPAGATAAATALDTDSDVIRTTRTGDIIQSDMIVEMAYHPERAPGWRWEPTRIRHDKTERWLRGARSGTMNADWVANSIWSSLHNPVTEEAVRTGKTEECLAPAALVAPASYYNRRAPARDLMKVQCLRNFHNDYIKRNMLLRPTLGAKKDSLLADLAMGKAGDLHKWMAAGVGYVFGCDVAAANLNDPADGAYRRLLDKMIAMGGRDRVPPMTFVQADAARRLITGEAGVTTEDQALLRREFTEGGPASGGFDVVSCMFALHYMFRDTNTLAGFLQNLAETIKVGGYFIGCGFDGDAVARLMSKENTVVGRDSHTDVWVLNKRYGAGIGSSVPPSDAGLGLAVDVDFISIGETHTEYLVSWPYLQARLAEAGLELLTPAECAELGVPASTQMFSESWAHAEATGTAFNMTEAVKRFSFLNRWYIFKRRSDRRPAPPAGVPAPPAALTEMASPTATEAAVLGAAVGAAAAGAGEAPALEAGAPTLDVIELPLPGVEGEAAAAAVVEPPSRTFLVGAPNAVADNRLGMDLADWPTYMGLGTLIPGGIPDLADETVRYPSVEAAIASAKFQQASDKPPLGPQFFRLEAAIHQKFERMRDGKTPAEIAKITHEQTGATRIASAGPRMRQYGAAWDKDKWATARDTVYKSYLARRYALDDRFRRMVDGIKALGGEILFANGTDPTELGVGVRVDGSISGGDNLVGRWMLALGE
jgi:hypothetical protein